MGGRKAITPDAQEVYDSRPSTAPNALPVRPPGHSSRRKPRSRQQVCPTGGLVAFAAAPIHATPPPSRPCRPRAHPAAGDA